MTALLLTNNYPPGLGGVSRYYAGLVATSEARIHVSGVDIPEEFGLKHGLRGRLAEVRQARALSRTYSKRYAILSGQPHMAVGARLAGVPYGLIIHGGEWQDYPKGQSLLDRVLAGAVVIGCNSFATRDEWIPTHLHDRVIVIHPGTPDFVESTIGASRIREASLLGEFRVLCVSRLSPRKGIARLIQAAEQCARSGVDLQLDIVGEGPEWQNLSGLVTMPDRIKLHGRVEDEHLAEFYSQADLFAMLPHRIPGGETWEGFGIVYLEAAASGLPVVATNSGGVAEAVTPDGSVLLDEGCSADEVAKLLIDLAADPARRSAMSQANLQWAYSQQWAERSELVGQFVDRLEAGAR